MNFKDFTLSYEKYNYLVKKVLSNVSELKELLDFKF